MQGGSEWTTRRKSVGEQISDAVTNIIKLTGVYLVVSDSLTEPAGVDSATLIVAAFLMAGAQGIDSLKDLLIGGRK